MVNVIDPVYEARGDGSDDTEAIRLALGAALGQDPAGDLYFPPGTYGVDINNNPNVDDSVFVVSKDMVVRGQVDASVIKCITNPAPEPLLREGKKSPPRSKPIRSKPDQSSLMEEEDE